MKIKEEIKQEELHDDFVFNEEEDDDKETSSGLVMSNSGSKHNIDHYGEVDLVVEDDYLFLPQANDHDKNITEEEYNDDANNNNNNIEVNIDKNLSMIIGDNSVASISNSTPKSTIDDDTNNNTNDNFYGKTGRIILSLKIICDSQNHNLSHPSSTTISPLLADSSLSSCFCQNRRIYLDKIMTNNNSKDEKNKTNSSDEKKRVSYKKLENLVFNFIKSTIATTTTHNSQMETSAFKMKLTYEESDIGTAIDKKSTLVTISTSDELQYAIDSFYNNNNKVCGEHTGKNDFHSSLLFNLCANVFVVNNGETSNNNTNSNDDNALSIDNNGIRNEGNDKKKEEENNHNDKKKKKKKTKESKIAKDEFTTIDLIPIYILFLICFIAITLTFLIGSSVDNYDSVSYCHRELFSPFLLNNNPNFLLHNNNGNGNRKPNNEKDKSILQQEETKTKLEKENKDKEKQQHYGQQQQQKLDSDNDHTEVSKLKILIEEQINEHLRLIQDKLESNNNINTNSKQSSVNNSLQNEMQVNIQRLRVLLQSTNERLDKLEKLMLYEEDVVINDDDNIHPAIKTVSTEKVTKEQEPFIPLFIDDDIILPHYTLESLKDPLSSQYQAYVWLLNDPFLNTYSEFRKLQRFVLATLYFSTNGNGNDSDFAINHDYYDDNDECQVHHDDNECYGYSDGNDHIDYDNDGLNDDETNLYANNCNNVDDYDDDEEYYDYYFYFGWKHKTDWLDYNVHECDWYSTASKYPCSVIRKPQKAYSDNKQNIYSNDDTVYDDNDYYYTHLSLENNYLYGTLPKEIFLLTTLTNINLSKNFLSGFIPSVSVPPTPKTKSTTGSSSSNQRAVYLDLKRLNLSNNYLEGSIPSSLSCFTNLHKLRLDNNYLTGTIPETVNALTNLRNLRLHHNDLTGTIPESLNSLTNLEHAYFYDNYLSGNVPSQLCSLVDDLSVDIDDDDNYSISCYENYCEEENCAITIASS